MDYRLSAYRGARPVDLARCADRDGGITGKIVGAWVASPILGLSRAPGHGRRAPGVPPRFVRRNGSIVDPKTAHDKAQATSGSTFPVVIV